MKHHRRRIPRLRPNPLLLRNLVPNIATGAACACGITSIRFACAGAWIHAVVFILVACMLDGIDGRLARLLGATSRLGAELDSLSDFVCFGVAPALLLYFWATDLPAGAAPLPRLLLNLLWALALFYALCGAFRLARFNTMLDEPTSPAWKHFFMGLPAPGGAGLCMMPILWELGFMDPGQALPGRIYFALASLFACGALLACRIPTPSIKRLRISRPWLVPFLLLVLLTIAFLVAEFWKTLCAIGFLYYLSIPVCAWLFIRLSARIPPSAEPLPPSIPPAP
ncbi:MAG: phosphatidylcholine/phosphatidylserine synthase [Kiritimatiellae bacterium]|nr:phosphatidylcholine/phosphatidylserine synthase [Kiritimatiellia bacterium]